MTMKLFCETCGKELGINESQLGKRIKCPHCGGVFTASDAAAPKIGIIADKIADVAGLERIQGFSWGGLFSEVFRSHTEEELERHWAAGSVGNIPTIDKVDTSWPQPWVFVRVFFLALLTYGILYFGWSKWQNSNLIPGLVAVGTFAMPLTLVIFFFEMNARKNVSFYLAMKAFFVGGVLSLITSLFMFQVSYFFGLGWLGDSVAGVAEEIGKLMAVLIIVRSARYGYILNGLLFGAAIGAGFAAFESAGYALNQLLNGVIKISINNADDILKKLATLDTAEAGQLLSSVMETIKAKSIPPMFDNIIMRAWLTGLAAHILWTGMSAGALWLVKGARPFQWAMLLDYRFLRIFAIAVGCHMVWNSDWQPNFITEYDKYFLLGLISWCVVFAMIQSGLSQLRSEKAMYKAAPETESGLGEVIREQATYVQSLLTLRHNPLPMPSSLPVPKPKEAVQKQGHLNIQEQVNDSDKREANRPKPSLSNRAWQKYYKKDE